MDKWPMFSSTEKQFREKMENSPCVFKTEINELIIQVNRLNEFMKKLEPMIEHFEDYPELLEYVRVETNLKKKRAQMLEKITEKILGNVILVALSGLGWWIWNKFKDDFLK